jgi:hypothetical protein
MDQIIRRIGHCVNYLAIAQSSADAPKHAALALANVIQVAILEACGLVANAAVRPASLRWRL